MFTGNRETFAHGGEYLEFLDTEMELGSTYSELNFRRCLFQNVGFKKAQFLGGLIAQSKFSECYLPHAKFDRVDLTGTSFVNCVLREADLTNCYLDYVTFSGCELDYRKVLSCNCLRWEDTTRWRLIRSLRMNATTVGDIEGYNWLLLKELEATRKHELSKFTDTKNPHNKQKYGRREQWGGLGRWFIHQIQHHAWGYGLRPLTLFRNGLLILTAVATLDFLSRSRFYVSSENIRRAIGFWESMYVSVVTFTTLGYGDISPFGPMARITHSVEAMFGAIFLGLFAATAFRRIGR